MANLKTVVVLVFFFQICLCRWDIVDLTSIGYTQGAHSNRTNAVFVSNLPNPEPNLNVPLASFNSEYSTIDSDIKYQLIVDDTDTIYGLSTNGLFSGETIIFSHDVNLNLQWSKQDDDLTGFLYQKNHNRLVILENDSITTNKLKNGRQNRTETWIANTIALGSIVDSKENIYFATSGAISALDNDLNPTWNNTIRVDSNTLNFPMVLNGDESNLYVQISSVCVGLKTANGINFQKGFPIPIGFKLAATIGDDVILSGNSGIQSYSGINGTLNWSYNYAFTSPPQLSIASDLNKTIIATSNKTVIAISTATEVNYYFPLKIIYQIDIFIN